MGENLFFFAFAFIDRSKLCVFPKALRFKSKFITAELARLFSQSDSEEDFEGFDEDDARVDRRHFKMQFKTKVWLVTSKIRPKLKYGGRKQDSVKSSYMNTIR